MESTSGSSCIRRQGPVDGELAAYTIDEAFSEFFLKTIRVRDTKNLHRYRSRLQGIHLNSSDIWQACGMLLHGEVSNTIPSPKTGLQSVFMSLPRSMAMALLKTDESVVFPEKSASGLKFSG